MNLFQGKIKNKSATRGAHLFENHNVVSQFQMLICPKCLQHFIFDKLIIIYLQIKFCKNVNSLITQYISSRFAVKCPNMGYVRKQTHQYDVVLTSELSISIDRTNDKLPLSFSFEE